MCHFYRQNTNLNDIKRGVINQVAPIVRVALFLHSPLALVLTVAALKRSAREGKQPQHYDEYTEWYRSIINECITIPIAHRLFNHHPESDSAVSSLWLYPTSAR
jgi:hypothetical protein